MEARTLRLRVAHAHHGMACIRHRLLLLLSIAPLLALRPSVALASDALEVRQQIEAASSLSEAFRLTKPFFHVEFSDNVESDGGATASFDDGLDQASFEWWCAKHLRWSDVDSRVDATSIPLIDRDRSGEQGKHLCLAGIILQIKAGYLIAGPVDSEPERAYQAQILMPDKSSATLVVIRSAGKIVVASQARFCGMYTNLMYQTLANGDRLPMPFLVGMFDLRENKKTPR